MQEYTSTFVRYERRGDRVIPVRVTKAWVEPPEQRSAPGKQKVLSAKLARRFTTVRVTELRKFPNGDVEHGPEAWTSWAERVESRERMLTLDHHVKSKTGGIIREPILFPAGAGEPTLEIGNAPLSWAQANAPMDAEPDTREWHIRREWAESRGYEDDEQVAA